MGGDPIALGSFCMIPYLTALLLVVPDTGVLTVAHIKADGGYGRAGLSNLRSKLS